MRDSAYAVISGRPTQPAHLSSNSERLLEDRADAKPARQAMAAHRFQRGRGDAAAVGAVGLAAELTRRNLPLEVGGNAGRCLREHAVLGRFRWADIRVDEARGHPELRIFLAEMHQGGDDAFAIGGGQTLVGLLADLRRVEADPNLSRVRILGPEPDELFEIPVAPGLLPRHRAMNGDLVPLDVFENPVVGCRLAALVVLRLKSVDRHNHLQARKPDPFRRNRPHGAGDDLDIQSHLRESRQDLSEFPVADEWFAAYDRDVKRPMRLDQREKAIDKFLAFEVADLTERHIAAEVVIAVGVTTGTPEGAFAGDLDRQGRTIAAKDSSPCRDNAFHPPDYNKGC